MFAVLLHAHTTGTRSFASAPPQITREVRDELAGEVCQLPDNRTHMPRSLMGRSHWRPKPLPEWMHGGYCLIPSSAVNYVSPGNLLAVGHYTADGGLVQVLAHCLEQGASILELGAGQGALKAATLRLRPDLQWLALDGAVNVESYTKELVGYHDVCNPWPSEQGRRRFDWVVSIEMAEHIPPHCEPQLIELLGLARRGIVLSWSASSVGSHINAHDLPYVVELIRSRTGMLVDNNATDVNRALLRRSHRYLQTGLRVYRRP